jgi:hypothetical protein
MELPSSSLEKELARLQEQIERVRKKRDALKGELRLVEAELEKVYAERQRFDAVRAVCTALDRLAELKANELFWDGAAEARQAAGLVERARGRLARFEGELNGILEKQTSLKEQIDRCLGELSILDDEVRDAYDREARREEEYVVEREISPVPDRAVVMPWSREAESEKRFRKALLVALLAAFFLGTLIPLLNVPAPVRPAVVVVPERLVSMLRKEPPRPEPPKEEKKPEKEQEEKAPKEDRPKPATPEAQAARKKAESTGVLAFKESFKDLMDETPAARLGSQARLSSQPPAGRARAGRSLVSLPSTVAGSSSGGISNSGINRTIDQSSGKRIASVGFTRVESKVAELKEEAKPVSSGAGSTRTDEEIQIVFDKYKAALYRMYNVELRKIPTLRGKIVLRITIEPDGEVSACTVQSNDLNSPDLVAQIVARVKKFNFGPKEKVSKTTILYPIDFLPGG